MSMTRQASDACGKASMDMRSLSYQNRNPTRPDMADGSWCSITKAWQLPPLPLTEELILKVGASFKAGQYKSTQNYFSQALQEHRNMTKNNPSFFLQQFMRNTIRSITRGVGPTPFMDSFAIEPLPGQPLRNFPTDHASWLEDRTATMDATLICCWWLFCGIEAARATTLHVRLLRTFLHLWHCASLPTKVLQSTTPYYKVLLQYYSVLQSTGCHGQTSGSHYSIR